MAARKTTTKKPAAKKPAAKRKPAAKKPRGGTKGKGTRDGSKRKPVATEETFTMHDHLMEVFNAKFLDPTTKGRPRMFEKPEDMAVGIARYFQHCVDTTTHPTITGLSLSLGFSSLNGLNNYEGYEDADFHSLIKYAKHLIEHGYEKSLLSSYHAGARFALTNIGKNNWAEKVETKVSGGLNNTDKIINMTPTERTARLKTLLTNAQQRQEEDNGDEQD